MQELNDGLAEVRKQAKGINDQVLAGEYERNQRLEQFRREAAERRVEMERYTADWVRYSDQYSTAKAALQAIETLQEQLDKRQRETDELVRVELNRSRAQWDSFSLEQVKRWKNFETDQEQRWQSNQRSGQQFLDQLKGLQDVLETLNKDRDTLWRVQTAQGEALKRLPLIWMEEVEKAIEHDPNTRRQPALVPVREE
jgi:DNA repair exonuclease SbcCD ATPase subunit